MLIGFYVWVRTILKCDVKFFSIPICIADHLCFFFTYNWLMHFFSVHSQLWFQHAQEWRLHAKCDEFYYDTHECDYDTQLVWFMHARV
jgi:hypothetical protein